MFLYSGPPLIRIVSGLTRLHRLDHGPRIMHIHNLLDRGIALGRHRLVLVATIVVLVRLVLDLAHHNPVEIDAGTVGAYLAEQCGQTKTYQDGYDHTARVSLKKTAEIEMHTIRPVVLQGEMLWGGKNGFDERRS